MQILEKKLVRKVTHLRLKMDFNGSNMKRILWIHTKRSVWQYSTLLEIHLEMDRCIPVHVNLGPGKSMYQSYLLPPQVLPMKTFGKLEGLELLASLLVIHTLQREKIHSFTSCIHTLSGITTWLQSRHQSSSKSMILILLFLILCIHFLTKTTLSVNNNHHPSYFTWIFLRQQKKIVLNETLQFVLLSPLVDLTAQGAAWD